MSKVKIESIVNGANDYFSFFRVGFLDSKEIYVFTKKKKSFNRFDKSHSLVIEQICKFIFPIVIHYYLLKSLNDSLDKKTQENLESFSLAIERQFKEAKPKSHEIKMFNQLLEQFKRLDIVRRDFLKPGYVIFNDTSKEHLKAFNAISQNEIPKNNILIKLKMRDVHIRWGIRSDRDKKKFSFTIIDIVKKAIGNK